MRRLGELVRAAVATLALAGAGYLSTTAMASQAQQVAANNASPAAGESTGDTVAGQDSFLEFAVKQGGALLVLMAVLWFYRRDYKTLAEFWRDSDDTKTRLIEEHTRASTEMAAALRENTSAVRQAQAVMQQQQAVMQNMAAR